MFKKSRAFEGQKHFRIKKRTNKMGCKITINHKVHLLQHEPCVMVLQLRTLIIIIIILILSPIFYFYIFGV